MICAALTSCSTRGKLIFHPVNHALICSYPFVNLGTISEVWGQFAPIRTLDWAIKVRWTATCGIAGQIQSFEEGEA